MPLFKSHDAPMVVWRSEDPNVPDFATMPAQWAITGPSIKKFQHIDLMGGGWSLSNYCERLVIRPVKERISDMDTVTPNSFHDHWDIILPVSWERHDDPGVTNAAVCFFEAKIEVKSGNAANPHHECGLGSCYIFCYSGNATTYF
ncbi:uncharacterized protein A4U43_C03F20110 [Asparagus officinalis]|uniref:Uncharacterized protein n=1 Tax=Asparagus officinalis TaxID=4686 RepID=A0A5P1FEC8_ASPOF|nr:uncharacterized protein A4U43_C03F20110 [Asparagus officinalis]